MRAAELCLEKGCPWPASPGGICRIHALMRDEPHYFTRGGAAWSLPPQDKIDVAARIRQRLDRGPAIEWTPQRVALLRWAWSSRWPRGEIARRVVEISARTGLHRAAIESAARRLGISERRRA